MKPLFICFPASILFLHPSNLHPTPRPVATPTSSPPSGTVAPTSLPQPHRQRIGHASRILICVMPWKTKFAKFASPRRGACGGLCLDTCGPLLIRILTEAARRQMRHCKRANHHGHSRHPVPSAAHWTRCTHPCDDAKFASPRRGACGGGYGTFAWTHVTAADTILILKEAARHMRHCKRANRGKSRHEA